MKSYTRYLQLLQDFQFRIINPLENNDSANNYRFGDLEEINLFKNYIIAELKMAAPGNVRLKLKKLKELNRLFMEFDKKYPDIYEKATEGNLKGNNLIKSFPFLKKMDLPDETLSAEHIKTLYQSILFRQKSLLDMINQTEDLMAAAQD